MGADLGHHGIDLARLDVGDVAIGRRHQLGQLGLQLRRTQVPTPAPKPCPAGDRKDLQPQSCLAAARATDAPAPARMRSRRLAIARRPAPGSRTSGRGRRCRREERGGWRRQRRTRSPRGYSLRHRCVERWREDPSCRHASPRSVDRRGLSKGRRPKAPLAHEGVLERDQVLNRVTCRNPAKTSEEWCLVRISRRQLVSPDRRLLPRR